jgi:GntR family transcriptional regulator
MKPSNMQLAIDLDGGIPIYRQIAAQIQCRVASGLLEPDACLPSICALASELTVAPNTIAKAYEELEAAGIVHKRRGFGTFVSIEHTQAVDQDRQRIVERRIDALLTEARQLKFTDDALLALMQRRQASATLDDGTADPGK